MKKILLAVILLAATFSVKAWHYSYDKAVLLVAAQHLNPETLNLVKEYVGEGQTFFNMKRQHLPIVSYDGKTTYQPSKEMYVVPVPNIEYENRYE